MFGAATRRPMLLLLALAGGAVAGGLELAATVDAVEKALLLDDDICEGAGREDEACSTKLLQLRGTKLKAAEPATEQKGLDGSKVIFRDLDTNGDGEVQKEELDTLLSEASDEEKKHATALFQASDEDGSKGLSEAEFAKALESAGWGFGGYGSAYGRHGSAYGGRYGSAYGRHGSAYGGRYGSAYGGGHYGSYGHHWLMQNGEQPAFRDLDANGDGEVQREELDNLLSEASDEEKKHATALFQASDEDGSKGLSEAEFAKAIKLH